MFWKNKKEPEPQQITVSGKTIAFYELLQDIIEYSCQSQAVIYGPDGMEWQCGECRVCEKYEDSGTMRLFKTGLNRRKAGDPENQVQQIYWHPAFRRILDSLRDLNGDEIGEKQHFYNVLYHIGTHSDEVLEWMSKSNEEREALKRAYREAQEQLAAEKARETEE